MFRNFFYSVGLKMQRLMFGRYGYDAFSRFLSVAAFVLLGIHILFVFWPFYFVGSALIIWSVFRCFSRHMEARRKELYKYQAVVGKISGWLRMRRRIFLERKINKYYRCKRCKAYLKVPKGRGKLEISCPKCHYTFVKKT